jgi:hypothetical protein
LNVYLYNKLIPKDELSLKIQEDSLDLNKTLQQKGTSQYTYRYNSVTIHFLLWSKDSQKSLARKYRKQSFVCFDCVNGYPYANTSIRITLLSSFLPWMDKCFLKV